MRNTLSCFFRSMLPGFAAIALSLHSVPTWSHCGEHAGTCDDFTPLEELGGFCEDSSNPSEFGTWWQYGEIKSHWCITTDAVVNEQGEVLKESTCRFNWECNPKKGDADCWRVPGAIGGVCRPDLENPAKGTCLCQQATCTVCAEDRPDFVEPQACLNRPAFVGTHPFEADPRCPPRVPCEGPSEGGAWTDHGAYMLALSRVLLDDFSKGLIDPNEMGGIIAQGAASTCGSD